MVYHVVKRELASSAKGYFESLVKRAESVTSTDPALRQVKYLHKYFKTNFLFYRLIWTLREHYQQISYLIK